MSIVRIQSSPYTVSQHRLSNGLRLVHVETTLQRASCVVLARVGSRDEGRGEHGLVHLLEHMLFKGTKRRRAYHVSTRLESVGGDLNASTSKEELMLQATVLPRDLARSMELVSDIVQNASFPAHELEREREVVLEEIASYRDSVVETLFDEGEELVYGDSALGHPILGTRASVRGFTREDLSAFKSRYFVASNMVVCTSGPFSAHDVFAQAERYFIGIPRGEELPPRALAAYAPPQCCWRTKRTAQTHCLLLGQAIPDGDPDLDKLFLLMNIVAGDAANSRLNLLLREKHGLVYTLESDIVPLSDTGFYSIYFGTDKAHVVKALAMVTQELRAMTEVPLSRTKLQSAKRQYLGQLALSRVTAEALSVDNGRRALRDQPPITQEQLFSAVETITADDLQRMATRVFDENRYYTLLYR